MSAHHKTMMQPIPVDDREFVTVQPMFPIQYVSNWEIAQFSDMSKMNALRREKDNSLLLI